ncbi:MAG: DNA repair and recombination protein RadA [Candidatus Omnitrophica bacterium]|nr:DNA repair and recombination protein RadA [Candidatus Omnitrophota bacterium]
MQESGISTAEALAMSPHNIISEIDGLGDKTAKKLIWHARNALKMTEFITADDIDENTEYITTGSSELNRILGGGFQTGKLTEVYGPFKSGKTNLAHTIAVTIQLPKKKGGLGSTVAYIDTENTFSKEKIKRIAKRFGLEPKKVLSQIYHARIYSSDHQMQMIQKAETLCKTRNVRLIVVDSLMSLLRAEYVGIGMLARRQGVLNNMIHGLSRVAETYNCAILLTNQVSVSMKGMFSANDAIGGNIVAHGCHFRVMFKTKGFSSNNSLKRRAIIVDAPDLPPEEAEFYITSVGIADTEKGEVPEAQGLDFEVEALYEEEESYAKESEVCDNSNGKHSLIDVKGIGAGTAKNLIKVGVNSVEGLVSSDPEQVASKISGVSSKMVIEWQTNAKALLSA